MELQSEQPLYAEGSISSYAASAAKPDITYTLEIATEVSQYMEEAFAVPSFDRAKKI